MRLFVAVNVSDDISRQLREATAALRAPDNPVRWVRPEGLHVTVRFLGDVDEAVVPELCTALDETTAAFRAFELVYNGCSVFPNVSRPRVLWAACEPEPTLELIQHELETRFEVLGFPAGGRPFRPHVTLGRVRRNAARTALRPLAAEIEAIEFSGADCVESIDLMSSTLGPGGARYDMVHRSVLGAT